MAPHIDGLRTHLMPLSGGMPCFAIPPVSRLPAARHRCGALFRLTPPTGGGTPWSESALYKFCLQSNCTDGFGAAAGPTVGADGALYSTTIARIML